MPSEVWLHPNSRPALVVLCAAAAIAIIATILGVTALWRTSNSGSAMVFAFLAAGLAGGAIFVAVAAYWRARRPRVYREDSQLRFRVASRPIPVPLEVVEAFFLGRGPAHLPGGLGERLETVNLVARLSQRATEWHQRETDPRLGTWCGGYITIRGTCSEPLSVDIVNRLNKRLSAAKRESMRNA